MNVSEAFTSRTIKSMIGDHVLRNGFPREGNSTLKLLTAPSCHVNGTLTLKHKRIESVFSTVNGLVKGELRLGAEILQVGGIEKVYRRIFSVREGEQLLKASQCCLYTTAGPIPGRLFISTHKLAFCSHTPVATVSSPDAITRERNFSISSPSHPPTSPPTTVESRAKAKLSERALELLALPEDGAPRLLLDIGCGSGLSGETLSENGHQWIGCDISQAMLDVAVEQEVEGDLFLADMGQGLGFRPGVIDGAISISAVQWLCNADKSCHEPRLRLKSLARGARAVLQVYPQNDSQRKLFHDFAMQAGFAGGVVVDYPHSSKSRKEYLVLTCGPPSLSSAVPNAKGEDGDSSADDDSGGDEGTRTVSVSDRNRPRKRQRVEKKGEGREWLLRRKEKMRRGNDVPADSKYTGRKRKRCF